MALITNLDTLADSIEQLPTLPAVYQQVKNAMADASCSVTQISKIISYDQAITAKLLQLVNSSFYGFKQRINNTTHAIALLGFRTIEDLILAVSVFPALKNGNDEFAEELRESWLHSIGVAAAARAAANILHFANSDDAFTMGLLHDIGKVALCRIMHDEMVAVLETTHDQNEPFHEVEQQLLGFDHTDVGRLLAEKWNFADDLTEVIGYHHTPMEARQHKRNVSVLHLTDIIARIVVPDGNNECIPTLDMEAWQETGMTIPQIETLMHSTLTEFEKAKAFVSILD